MFRWKDVAQALRRPAPASPAGPRCGSCRRFRNDPAYLEAALPGLSSLSSGAASVRADDGLCLLHERLVGARFSCADYAATI